MVGASFANAKTLTGRLAIFFGAISIFVGVVAFSIVQQALLWSEDRVSERRILIDKDEAIARFKAGEYGKITIDVQTVAYNDTTLLPEQYQYLLSRKKPFGMAEGLQENDLGDMTYKGHYSDNGKEYDVVLISKVESVEFSDGEILFVSSGVLCLVLLLMTVFGILLYRLSKKLIAPLNDLAEQLEKQTGDSNMAFTVSSDAADEFQALAQHLNQYRLELHQTLKREQAFARYASHELRTPLTVAKGAAKLLSRAEKSEFQSRQVERIESATEQMSTMVDALLAIVRYERNIEDAPLRKVSQKEIESVVSSNGATGKNIHITLTFSGEPEIRATSAVLNMVLGNLIRNAIAATSEGEITILVDSDSIQVIDGGPGLGDTPSNEGHGLGLMIVDDLTQRYGWKFSLEDYPGRGCVARIDFICR